MPIVIGVAGGSGSGKTTVVERLVARLGPAAASVLEHDRYYRDQAQLPPDARARLNFDHPDALDTDLLVTHVRALRRGIAAAMPVYDFARHARDRRVDLVLPRETIIVEGILVLIEPALRALMDIKVFISASPDVRLARRLRRDVDERGRTAASVLTQYHTTVRPMHDTFVEPSRDYADVVIDNNETPDAALDDLLIRLEAVRRPPP